MSQSQFQLEVYEPGDASTVVGCWPCAAPVPMAVGDVLHTALLQPNELPRHLKVTRIEHAMWLRDGWLAHKLMVFTELA